MNEVKEDGFNAGQRNIGRLFLFAIPLALGLGASTWLGVWIGIHQWKHELSQQDRAAAYVGAMERPTSKIKVDIVQKGCVTIDKVDLDGKTLLIYTTNHCHTEISYLDWHWALLSPAGVSIAAEETNGCTYPYEPNDKSECKMKVSDDDRGALLRVWLDPSAGGWGH